MAKFFAGKFATGSSVSKNPQGEDEIVVQGDVGDEIVSRDVDVVGSSSSSSRSSSIAWDVEPQPTCGSPR